MAAARAWANGINARVARGEKPFEDDEGATDGIVLAQPTRPVMTCQEAWTAYLRESGEFGGNAEKTLIDKRQTWDRLFAHTIGESLPTDVTFLELADIVDPLKTKGRRTAFNNAVRYVKKFFHGGGRIGSSHWAVGFTGSTAQDRKAEHA